MEDFVIIYHVDGNHDRFGAPFDYAEQWEAESEDHARFLFTQAHNSNAVIAEIRSGRRRTNMAGKQPPELPQNGRGEALKVLMEIAKDKGVEAPTRIAAATEILRNT